MTKILVTTATGATGRPLVDHLLAAGSDVRAMVRTDDDRAQRLRAAGAEVVIGNLRNLRDVRAALAGTGRAYFNYPIGDGLVEAAVMFAQTAREQDLELVVTMSQLQSRPKAHSTITQSHWLAEQVLDWSGVPATHLRTTFFLQWLHYLAPLIRSGRWAVPFDPAARFAPIAVDDIALVAANVLADPAAHAGRTYPITGPTEYSHAELAAEVGRLLGRELPVEQITVTAFVELITGAQPPALIRHFEGVGLDLAEGLLSGVDDTAHRLAARPLTTLPDYVQTHRPLLTPA